VSVAANFDFNCLQHKDTLDHIQCRFHYPNLLLKMSVHQPYLSLVHDSSHEVYRFVCMYYFSICTTYLIHFPILCYVNFRDIANHSVNFLQLQHILISYETDRQILYLLNCRMRNFPIHHLKNVRYHLIIVYKVNL